VYIQENRDDCVKYLSSRSVGAWVLILIASWQRSVNYLSLDSYHLPAEVGEFVWGFDTTILHLYLDPFVNCRHIWNYYLGHPVVIYDIALVLPLHRYPLLFVGLPPNITTIMTC
jgi:hypothetical protein